MIDKIFYNKRESRALIKHGNESDLETDGIGHNLAGEKPEYYYQGYLVNYNMMI